MKIQDLIRGKILTSRPSSEFDFDKLKRIVLNAVNHTTLISSLFPGKEKRFQPIELTVRDRRNHENPKFAMFGGEETNNSVEGSEKEVKTELQKQWQEITELL